MATSSWLLMASPFKQRASDADYDDVPSSRYGWDSSVQNHGDIQVGDRVVIWDKKLLLGASVIEAIDKAVGTKVRRRCPTCGSTNVKPRETKRPRYRCGDPACRAEADSCDEEEVSVETYLAHYGSEWIELGGILGGADLRRLCLNPKSQLSMRPIDWSRFTRSVESAAPEVGALLGLYKELDKQSYGGHSPARCRVRRGQQKFRRSLLARYGPTCALSGPLPEAALEAAHLYSYAQIGRHHDGGGVLLRRDLHNLLDLGAIAVDPDTLRLDLSPDIVGFAAYGSLHGQSLAVEIPPETREWLRMHWSAFRPH